MLKPLLLGAVTLLSIGVAAPLAKADALAVECGKDITWNDDYPTVVEPAISISATSLEEFEGPVGGSWSLELGGKEVPKNAKGVSVTIDQDQWHVNAIIIRVIHARTASRPVGTEYIIYNPYSEESVRAEKYNIGGFTGRIKVGSFKCYSMSA